MRFRAAREQVLATCLELADLGYLAGTGGNVALRADAAHFAVTPSAVDYYSMSANDVCIVALSDERQLDGVRPASVESGLHAGVLRAHPECNVSVHTHQPLASAYSLLCQPLEVRNDEHRRLLGKVVPCLGYAPSGTAWLAMRVAAALGPSTQACLMRNHGVVCLGEDREQAMARVGALESECAAFLLSRTGTALDPSVASAVRNALQAALTEEPR